MKKARYLQNIEQQGNKNTDFVSFLTCPLRSETEPNFPMAESKQPPQPQQQQTSNVTTQKYNYPSPLPGDYSNGNRLPKPSSPGNSQPPILPAAAITAASTTAALLQFAQPQQYKNSFGVHMDAAQGGMQEWRNSNMNGYDVAFT